jgi:dynein heavy chain
MCDYLRIQARDKCESLLDQYKDNVKQLGDRPTRLDLFSAFVATKESIKEQSRVMAREKDEVDRMYALMADFKVKMEAKDQVNREDLQKEVDEYAARSYEADEFADLQIPSMNKEIMTRSAELDEECQTMMGNLLGGDYVDPGKYNNAKYILQQLGDTKESIDNIKTTAAQLETYVKLFKLPVAEYQNLTDAVDLYETRMKLWTMVDKFNDDTDAWLNSDIRTIKVDDLVKDVQDVVKESTKLSKKAPEDLVCAKLKDEALKWKMWAPVLQDGLCNEALKNRHWAKIYKELGCGFEDDGFCPTLQFLNDNGVMLKKDFVLEMSGVASGEYSLEKSLEGIKTAWQEMNFEVKGHRDSKSVFILGSIEEITTLMEDSQMSLQTMTASKFVVGIRDSVEIWDKKLQLVSEVLDEWMTCQRNWMYLECIFGSADIQKQLPEESKKFQMVDKDWNDVMRRTSKNSNVLYATCQDSDSRDTLEMFINANQKLEEVTKSLEEYLETKRGSFPRFYFLSNDELLEILAQTRDPQAVQPHMQKCFDCISRLEFTDEPESTEIRAMLSPEQEKVVFTEPVFAKGAVENWLTTIEA